jgi:hypothetical protein
VLSLDKSYPADKINAACEKAVKLGLLSYRAVKGLLEAERDREKAASAATGEIRKAEPAKHKFVRSLSEYEAQLSLFIN